MPVAIACDSHRVDRVHPAARGPQTGHKNSARCLDRDRDRDRIVRTVTVLGEQSKQVLEARCVVADPDRAEQSSVAIDHGNVVVILSPVDSAGHVQRALLSGFPFRGVGPWQDHPAT